MSYLYLPAGIPSTKQALISVWFRAPGTALAAARAAYVAWRDNGGQRPLLNGVVPLMVFGPQPKQNNTVALEKATGYTSPPFQSYNWVDGSGWVVDGPYIPATPTTTQYLDFDGTRSNIDPSYIGIDCTGAYPALSVNLVLPDTTSSTIEGSFPGDFTVTDDATLTGFHFGGGVDAGAPMYDGSCMLPVHNSPITVPRTITETQISSQAGFTLRARPETFRLLPIKRGGDSGYDNADQEYNGQRIVPNRWHHLLLSFDLMKACQAVGVNGGRGSDAPRATVGSRTSSASRFWIALNDVNMTGDTLSCYHPTGYSDANAVLPVNGYYVATDTTFTITDTDQRDCLGNSTTTSTIGMLPTYKFTPSALNMESLGVPASPAYVSSVRHCELAELQIFETSINTGSTPDRRLFITDRGKPAPMAKASKTLGPPAIKIHGSDNWIHGVNTGQYANFAPQGRIIKYTPDPSLHGKQGVPQ